MDIPLLVTIVTAIVVTIFAVIVSVFTFNRYMHHKKQTKPVDLWDVEYVHVEPPMALLKRFKHPVN